MELAVKFLEKFESFIRRAMMPSIVFFIIFGVVLSVFLYTRKELYIDSLSVLIDKAFGIEFTLTTFTIFFIFLIGLSHILSMLTQMFFDNNIKEKYNTIFPFVYKKQENKELNNLRSRVIEKLKKDNVIFNENGCNNQLQKNLEASDVLLYQIVGRKLAYFEKGTSTNRYVDDTKASGIIFISFIISVIFISAFICEWYVVLFLLIVMKCIHIIGLEHIKTKYRSRAIRIYVNYLIDEKTEKT
ncbi:MAG: hypothetical protein U9N02_06085 [Campylobacterota bacterium]|nr:hypothetical protein [Campylobacterota bacterium]